MKEFKNTIIKYTLIWIIILIFFFTGLFTHIYLVKNNNRIENQKSTLIEISHNINNRIMSVINPLEVLAQDRSTIETLEYKKTNPYTKSLMYSVLKTSQASLVYILDKKGNIIYSLDSELKNILKGKNYEFRPYFYQGMAGKNVIYPALGVTTLKRGIYFSTPIFKKTPSSKTIGVAVLKIGLDEMDVYLEKQNDYIMVVSPENVIFSSNIKEWLFKTITPLSPKKIKKLKISRQFAGVDHQSIYHKISKNFTYIKNTKYEIVEKKLIIDGWKLIALSNTNRLPSLNDNQKQIFLILYFFLSILLLFSFFLVINVIRRKKIENDLKKSEQKFKAIFNHTFQFTGLIDVKGKLLEVNNSALERFKIDKKDVINHLFWETPWWTHNQELAMQLKQDIYLASKGQFIRNEVKMETNWGEDVYVDFSLKPIRDEKNNVIMIIPEGRDITIRKIAENKLLRSEMKYKNLYKSMKDGYVRTDLNGYLLEYNDAFLNMIDYAETEITNIKFADLLPGKWKDIDYQKKTEAERNGSSDSYEIEISKKYGNSLFVEQQVYINKNQNDKSDGFWRIIRDITEKKLTNEIMMQTEKMMSIGGLAAGMAHEINNPLGIILQSSQVLKRRVSGKIPKNIETANEIGIKFESLIEYFNKRNIFEYITAIEDSGTRAATIVKNMLKFSLPGQKNFSQIDINKLIDLTLELAGNDYNLSKKYDFKKTLIIKNYSKKLPDVFCEETEIEQVFFNLFKNSVYAMHRKKDDDINFKPEISIQTKEENNNIIIEISDNGPGIDKNKINHIFEPFYTTKPVGEGTGLGLSVSYFIIVNNHNGEIFVESKENHGTKFTIKLPIKNYK